MLDPELMKPLDRVAGATLLKVGGLWGWGGGTLLKVGGLWGWGGGTLLKVGGLCGWGAHLPLVTGSIEYKLSQDHSVFMNTTIDMFTSVIINTSICS